MGSGPQVSSVYLLERISPYPVLSHRDWTVCFFVPCFPLQDLVRSCNSAFPALSSPLGPWDPSSAPTPCWEQGNSAWLPSTPMPSCSPAFLRSWQLPQGWMGHLSSQSLKTCLEFFAVSPSLGVHPVWRFGGRLLSPVGSGSLVLILSCIFPQSVNYQSPFHSQQGVDFEAQKKFSSCLSSIPSLRQETQTSPADWIGQGPWKPREKFSVNVVTYSPAPWFVNRLRTGNLISFILIFP